MIACDNVVWCRRPCAHVLRAQSSHHLSAHAGLCLSKLNLLSSMAWLSTLLVPNKNLHHHTQLLHPPCRLASAQIRNCSAPPHVSISITGLPVKPTNLMVRSTPVIHSMTTQAEVRILDRKICMPTLCC